MEILCPTCQKKLQIADAYSGQVVKCPSCAATLQAPSLPGMEPPPELLASTPAAPEMPAPTFDLVPEPARPSSEIPHLVPPPPVRAAKPKSRDETIGSYTIHFRQEVVTLIPPIGLIALFFLSFFPWRIAEPTTLNLWELAFSHAGFTAFLFYVLLLLSAAPLTILMPFLDKNIISAPVNLRPYLSWSSTLVALLNLAAWFCFLLHYLHCNFTESLNPATIWMKLAMRIQTLIVVAAILDVWLQRRKRQELPLPRISMEW